MMKGDQMKRKEKKDELKRKGERVAKAMKKARGSDGKGDEGVSVAMTRESVGAVANTKKGEVVRRVSGNKGMERMYMMSHLTWK